MLGFDDESTDLLLINGFAYLIDVVLLTFPISVFAGFMCLHFGLF